MDIQRPLCLWLRVLLCICKGFGYIPFTYNPQTGRFEFSKYLCQISGLLFKVIRVVCGLVLVMFVIMLIPMGHPLEQRASTILDSIDRFYTFYCFCVSAYVISGSNLRYRNRLVVILNELLSVFETILLNTTGVSKDISIPSGLRTWLVWNVCLLPLQVLAEAESFRYTLGLSAIGFLLVRLTYWFHLSVQLVLICFYSKMNEFLQTFSGKMERHELNSKTRALIDVSFRIHKVKQMMDRYHSGFFVCLCWSLSHLLLVFCRGSVPKNDYFLEVVFLTYLCLKMLAVSFELFFIGHVANVLCETEAMFKEKVCSMFFKRLSLRSVTGRRFVDLLLINDQIWGLGTRAFRCLRVDQQLGFKLMRDVLIFNTFVLIQWKRYRFPQHSGMIRTYEPMEY